MFYFYVYKERPLVFFLSFKVINLLLFYSIISPNYSKEVLGVNNKENASLFKCATIFFYKSFCFHE